MIKHILVGASGLASDPDLLAAAFNLARPFSAHVDVLHVRRDPARDLPIYGEGFPADMLDTIIREAERNAEQASAAARRTFDQAVAAASIPVLGTAKERQDGGQENVTAGWREITGLPSRILAAEARFADLTLLCRPTGAPVDLSMLEGPLFEAGSPVLLTGDDMTRLDQARLDQVMIAWDGSPAAVRAVACAHDFITRAAKVTIMVVEDEAAGAVAAVVTGRPHPRPDRLVEHLAWHGVAAEIRLVS